MISHCNTVSLLEPVSLAVATYRSTVSKLGVSGCLALHCWVCELVRACEGKRDENRQPDDTSEEKDREGRVKGHRYSNRLELE